MRVEKIFFDMDGVLADFDRGIKELCRLPPRDQEIEDSEADDRMWDRIRRVDHFYNHLELIPGAKEMFLLLRERYGRKCEILTGIPKAKRNIPDAGEDKIKWVRRLLSEDIPVHIVYKEEKKQYCKGKGCILIDDYSRNIKEWEACGGTGILFTDSGKTIRALRDIGVLFP